MRREGLWMLALIAAGGVVTATSRGTHARTVQPGGESAARAFTSAPADGAARFALVGTATYYADAFQGGRMANGLIFDMNDVTVAASNRWPLGTRLRVRRAPGSVWECTLSDAEREGYYARTIVVSVQDRGAFTHELDLSRAAFALLARPDEGVIRVLVEPLEPG